MLWGTRFSGMGGGASVFGGIGGGIDWSGLRGASRDSSIGGESMPFSFNELLLGFSVLSGCDEMERVFSSDELGFFRPILNFGFSG